MVPDVAAGFATAERIEAEEGRTFVHPFEGPLTARGTATWAWNGWSRRRISTR